MHIKILGSGCKKCVALADNAALAAKRIGVDVEIEKITDVIDIARYGVMSTPGLVLDGVVVSSGRILTPQEIEQKLGEALQG